MLTIIRAETALPESSPRLLRDAIDPYRNSGRVVCFLGENLQAILPARTIENLLPRFAYLSESQTRNPRPKTGARLSIVARDAVPDSSMYAIKGIRAS
jgi:hypothetical protein